MNSVGLKLESFLKKHQLSKSEASKLIGCSHSTVYRIIAGERGISHKFSIKLSNVFKELSADEWMDIQSKYRINNVSKEKLK